MDAGGAAGAGAAAAIANAIKASGVLVRVYPSQFLEILGRAEAPLVVHAPPGWFSHKQRYLLSYKGFAFHTQTELPINLPPGAELIEAKSIWMPS